MVLWVLNVSEVGDICLVSCAIWGLDCITEERFYLRFLRRFFKSDFCESLEMPIQVFRIVPLKTVFMQSKITRHTDLSLSMNTRLHKVGYIMTVDWFFATGIIHAGIYLI